MDKNRSSDAASDSECNEREVNWTGSTFNENARSRVQEEIANASANERTNVRSVVLQVKSWEKERDDTGGGLLCVDIRRTGLAY